MKALLRIVLIVRRLALLESLVKIVHDPLLAAIDHLLNLGLGGSQRSGWLVVCGQIGKNQSSQDLFVFARNATFSRRHFSEDSIADISNPLIEPGSGLDGDVLVDTREHAVAWTQRVTDSLGLLPVGQLLQTAFDFLLDGRS